MTRLDCLFNEMEQIKKMHCLSFNLKMKCMQYYQIEIEAIQNYGAENHEISISGLENYE